MEYCGFRVNDFLKSYLLDRKIITNINNTLSSERYISYGVSQGSVLGPLFFIIFINDISNIYNDSDNINLNVYADDTSLSIYANSDYEISENMKLYVGKLFRWFTLNNLKLNIEKTKILPYFNTIIMHSIQIDNVDIELVNYYTLLDITLDSKLKYI